MSRLLYAFCLALLVPTAAWAGPIEPQVALCYFQASTGRSLDLSHLCGYSEINFQPSQTISGPANTSSPNPINSTQPRANGTNPGNPYGNSPNSLSQCYVVDLEGSPCTAQ